MLKKFDGVSIIIPMYNSKDTIIDTLNSIKNQTAFKHIIEIIIVNDGSKDNSLKLVDDYVIKNPDMPIVVIDKENQGVSNARNTGMEVSKGRWIALLDSDDVWLPNKLEIQINTILEHSEIDFLGGDLDDRGLKIMGRKINGLYKASVKDICLKMFPQTSTAIFKRSVYEQIGGYDENQKYAEDGNYFMKICAHFNYYHLPIQMVYFGGGKPEFGFSGLSANLKGMYEGNKKNIFELKRNSLISNRFFIFLRGFYWIKYIRRIIISKFRH